MISRVSDLQMFAELSANLGRLGRRIEELNGQVATGSRVNKPSDDPSGAGALVRAFSVRQTLDQDQRASDFARRFLAAQDGLLDDARNILDRAREIAVQQANEVYSDGERIAAAEEVHALLGAVVFIGNDELGGRRLFAAGAEVTGGAPPFVDPDDPSFDPANPYVGPASPFEVEIGTGQLVRITTPGDQVFGVSIAALADLEDRLRTGADTAGALTQLEVAADGLGVERSSVGARTQQVDGRMGQIRNAELLTSEAIATTRGADMVDIVTQLTQLQGQLQLSSAVSQRLLEANLVNLLGV